MIQYRGPLDSGALANLSFRHLFYYYRKRQNMRFADDELSFPPLECGRFQEPVTTLSPCALDTHPCHVYRRSQYNARHSYSLILSSSSGSNSPMRPPAHSSWRWLVTLRHLTTVFGLFWIDTPWQPQSLQCHLVYRYPEVQ